MRWGKQWLLLICEVVGVAAALLVLPCALIDFAFGTNLVSLLSPGAPLALACAIAFDGRGSAAVSPLSTCLRD